MKYLKTFSKFRWQDLQIIEAVNETLGKEIIGHENAPSPRYEFSRSIFRLKARVVDLITIFGQPTHLPSIESGEDKVNMQWDITLLHSGHDNSYVQIYDWKYGEQFDPLKELEWNLAYPTPKTFSHTINHATEVEILDYLKEQLQ